MPRLLLRSGGEAVGSAETAACAITIAGRSSRKSSRISGRLEPVKANSGERKTTDAPLPEDCLGEAMEASHVARPAAEPARGDSGRSKVPSPVPRNFPTSKPLKMIIRNLDDSKFEQGFDSDGNLPYVYDYEADDSDDDGEEGGEEEGGAEERGDDDGDDAGVVLPLEVHAIKEFGVVRLRTELMKRGLSQCGVKDALIARLTKGRTTKIGQLGKKKRVDKPMNGLPPEALWVLLNPIKDPCEEPWNLDSALKPPTELLGPVNPKFAYEQVFERSPFTGTDEKMVVPPDKAPRHQIGRYSGTLTPQNRNKSGRIPQPRVKGGPNIDHLKKHGLCLLSDPLDWFRSVTPLYPSDNLEELEDIDAIGDATTKFCVSNWRGYTNMKAEMCGAGQKGGVYEKEWSPMTNVDLFQMLGLMTLDGVAPQTQMRRRVRPESVERTCGNDLLAKCLGKNAGRRWQMFKKFFGVQDPTTNPPPRKSCPNYKCDSAFKWSRHIWKAAWIVSKTFAADEQTCPMRGKSIYKTRCGKFKRIGDGLQADCLADDGYTFDFYFRNEPVDEHWIKKGLSPLHARLMHMFSRLEDDGHEVNMDNLYNSVKFARHAYSLQVPQDRGEPRKKRVKTQGVVRPHGRGVTELVKQTVPKNKAALEAARGTTKVAVLTGDPMSEHLIMASCVDQKPFYMLSMAAEKIDWVTKKKMIYSHTAKKEVEHSFLRWSLSDTYNNEMNDNDIADQLRLIYRCLRFLRNTKWWWAEFLFIWETGMVNAYLLMKTYYIAMGFEPKWSHWQFQEEIAWALLDPDGPPLRSATNQNKVPSRQRESTGKKRKKMTMKSVGAGGVYSSRLDPKYNHFPTPVAADKKKTTVCQLHRLAGNAINQDNKIPDGARKDVMVCKDCDAALCIKCWSVFHSKEVIENGDLWKILNDNA